MSWKEGLCPDENLESRPSTESHAYSALLEHQRINFRGLLEIGSGKSQHYNCFMQGAHNVTWEKDDAFK